jgi:DNA-binding NtrC family response regulator
MSIEPIKSLPRSQGGLNERKKLLPARVSPRKTTERLEYRGQKTAMERFIGKLRGLLKARMALVVDDDPDFCETFRGYLVEKGYQVAVAYDGDEALASYVENRPDVVFLDVRMPGKNGIQVLRELKDIDPDAAVIMVSAVEDQDIIDQAKSEGVFYVNKPINFRYLNLAIETTLGLREGIVSSRG